MQLKHFIFKNLLLKSLLNNA